ncbi:oxidoreductase [Paraburkholderia dipogonis]|uniref:Oxidoreductase n=1 Tax=Paraburkholderia dipogonis TaxID=1211383 RepID=A0A4Y8MX82_9BURK|nr:oxidoreductase [Paraburkholderia dipogonis]TFE42019.1 oxidoreductase [Paraburkholderia dipogonis]
MSKQQVAIVTGASSGIGTSVAKKLAENGFRVFGTARSLAKAPSLPGVEFVEMDVSDDDSVQRGVQQVIERSGHVDVLINNAGTSLLGAMEEASITQVRTLFETNVFGAFRVTQAVLPHMRAQRAGRIVNISSVLGFIPGPYLGHYTSSKHALEGLSESLDHEVRRFGIRVAIVEPAYTRTNLDTQSARPTSTIGDYDKERISSTEAFAKKLIGAPGPDYVAATVVEAATGPWRMRWTPKGEASLLSKLRRFVPAKMFDSSVRKAFGLG